MSTTMSLFDWVPSPIEAPLFVAPQPGESYYEAMLRDYQREVVARAMEMFAAGVPSAIAVMATGLGKTQVYLEIARRYIASAGKGVLILAHRDELLKQPRKRWQEFYHGEMDIVANINTRERRSVDVPTAASVQSLCRPSRMLREFPDPSEIGLVIIDEAHHAVQKNRTYEVIREYFVNAQVLGVSATPERSDEITMRHRFQECVCDLDLEWGIDNGWLVRPETNTVQVSADFSAVGVRCGDIISSQLDELMNSDIVSGEIAAMLRDQCLGQTIYFAPGVDTALHVADLCQHMVNGIQVGVIASGMDRDPRPYVYSSSDAERRREFTKEFGKSFNHAINYGVLTEGFDAPATRYIIPRKTLSKSLYMQMLGRGTRVLPGVIEWQDNGGNWRRLESKHDRVHAIQESDKPSCNVMDVSGAAERYPSLTIADVMGGKFPEEVVHEVKELVRKGGWQPKDVMQELLEAQERREKRIAEEKRLAAMKQIAVNATYVVRKRSPEDVLREIGISNIRRIPEYARQAPSAAQINAFVDKMNGSSKKPFITHELAAGLSRGQIGEALKKLSDREKSGMATPAQGNLLMKYGLSPNVKKGVAKSTIDAIASNNWKLTPKIVEQHQRMEAK